MKMESYSAIKSKSGSVYLEAQCLRSSTELRA